MPQAISKFTIACPEFISGVNADATTKEHSERLVPTIGKVKARLTGRAGMRHLDVKSV